MTDTVQLPLAGTVAPVRLKDEPAAVAATDPPLQVVAADGLELKAKPEGKRLVKGVPVRADALELAIVRVRLEVDPAWMLVPAKANAKVGAVMTLSVATAAF